MPGSPPNNEHLHPAKGSRVRVSLETTGIVDGSRFNHLTGRSELVVVPERYPHLTIFLPVESEQYEATVELLPSAEQGTIDGDAS